jgi:hypothetical protein
MTLSIKAINGIVRRMMSGSQLLAIERNPSK